MVPFAPHDAFLLMIVMIIIDVRDMLHMAFKDKVCWLMTVNSTITIFEELIRLFM